MIFRAVQCSTLFGIHEFNELARPGELFLFLIHTFIEKQINSRFLKGELF